METAPKGDRKRPANRRETGRGHRGQKGGAHQIEWREDPVILGRVRAGLGPWAERKGPMECLAEVNEWLASSHPKEAPIALRTMYEDRERAAELVALNAQQARSEHLAEYDHLIAQAYKAFHDAKDTSLNRSAFLSVIGQATERKAKLRGLLDPKLAAVSGKLGDQPIEFTVVFDQPGDGDRSATR
jgi:hypothetical protein